MPAVQDSANTLVQEYDLESQNTYTRTEDSIKNKKTPFWRKILGFLLITAVVVGCCFLYVMGTFKKFLGIYYITGYGALSISYYFITTFFAYMNRGRCNKLADKVMSSPEDYSHPSVSVHITGYREDPEYFERCLRSVDTLSYPNLTGIVVSIDGNDEEDIYMADIALKVFGNRVTTVPLDFIPSMEKRIFSIGINTSNVPVYVITQPHSGKRDAMYSAYMVGKKLKSEFFMSTDSDTIMEKNTLSELVYQTFGEKKVDAVAGQLKIFNKENWLSYLSAARYFMAFNLERASQSFHGVVNCLSGPLGLYRMSSFDIVANDWVDQTFMGKRCTFGDDRHMTNQILSIGGRTTYTHRSVAHTETPTVYSRFVAQQTRWSKSYWRELLLQTQWVTRSWYLVMETVYGLLFPSLILATILTVIFTRTWWSLFAILSITFTMPLLRSLIAFFLFEPESIIFLNVLYPIMYFTTLLPVKFVALFTVNQTNWGTSSRKKIVNSLGPIVPVMIWICILTCGIVIHIVSGDE